MKHASILSRGACALLLAAASCGGGSDEFTAPAKTRVDLVISPLDSWVGAPVTFTVSASNDRATVASVAIDFTGDGSWDDTRDFHQASVAATFTHTYDSAGDFNVVAEARTSDGATASTELVLVVASKPPNHRVTYTMYGSSDLGGPCYAYGPPAECDDCAELLGTLTSSGVTKSFGSFPVGTRIAFEQGFNQWPVDPSRHVYSCRFVLNVYSGAPGSPAPLGGGTCATDSTSMPPVLNCWVTVSGTVK